MSPHSLAIADDDLDIRTLLALAAARASIATLIMMADGVAAPETVDAHLFDPAIFDEAWLSVGEEDR